MCDAKSRPLIIIKTRLSLSQLLNAESFYCSTTSSEYPDLEITLFKLKIFPDIAVQTREKSPGW